MSLSLSYLALLTMIALPLSSASGSFSFSYDPTSSVGPSHWANLTTGTDTNQCGGSKNSPIALPVTVCTDFADYSLKPGDCTVNHMNFTIENNGVKASYPTDGTCTLDELEMPGLEGIYQAVQFHIHISSEHTIGGSHFGAELHIVHQLKSDTEKRFAVVGLMIDPNSNMNNVVFNTMLLEWTYTNDQVLQACGLTTSSSDNNTSTRRRLQTAAVYSLVDPTSSYYHYDGGLTTPPCSEVVWWNVADTPLAISVMQFNKLTNLVLQATDPTTCKSKTVADPNTDSTSRPLVPLGNRTLQLICPTNMAGAGLSAQSDSEGENGAVKTASTTTSAASMLSVLGAAFIAIVTSVAVMC